MTNQKPQLQGKARRILRVVFDVLRKMLTLLETQGNAKYCGVGEGIL